MKYPYSIIFIFKGTNDSWTVALAAPSERSSKTIMASRIVEDCDGIYVENDDSLDEVDASQVFQVVSSEDIPCRYSRNSKEGSGWKKEKAARLRLVSPGHAPTIFPVFCCTTSKHAAFVSLFTVIKLHFVLLNSYLGVV